MNPRRRLLGATLRYLLVMVCTVAVAPGDSMAYTASIRAAQAPSSEGQPAKIPSDQLDSLVSPIALYPDPLLAQTMAASTYPLEIVQLQQWLARNPGVKDKALVDAVAKQQTVQRALLVSQHSVRTARRQTHSHQPEAASAISRDSFKQLLGLGIGSVPDCLRHSHRELPLSASSLTSPQSPVR